MVCNRIVYKYVVVVVVCISNAKCGVPPRRDCLICIGFGGFVRGAAPAATSFKKSMPQVCLFVCSDTDTHARTATQRAKQVAVRLRRETIYANHRAWYLAQRELDLASALWARLNSNLRFIIIYYTTHNKQPRRKNHRNYMYLHNARAHWTTHCWAGREWMRSKTIVGCVVFVDGSDREATSNWSSRMIAEWSVCFSLFLARYAILSCIARLWGNS